MVEEIYSEKEKFLWVSSTTKKITLIRWKYEICYPHNCISLSSSSIFFNPIWTDQGKRFYSNSIIEHLLNIKEFI